jgi:FrmR/RcnR family transcriptional regulator, repressor of frmRAB operon
MTHAVRDKTRLLHRTRRIAGQVGALERALDREAPCEEVLRLIAATRGALDALMAVVLEGHLQEHSRTRRVRGRDTVPTHELIRIVRAYLR